MSGSLEPQLGTQPPAHTPVLLEEVIGRLAPRPGEVHLDATLGAGGHAAALLARLGPSGLLVGIDRDREAVELARTRLEAVAFPFRVFQGVYSQLAGFMKLSGLPQEGALDGALFDLGLSSLQLDRPERGFSFLRDGPLDMRMSRGEGPSAAEYLEGVSLEELERVLREYGEEPAASRIARAIDRARRKAKLETTGQLASIVEGLLPRRGKRTHPATRTFQAIRIAVNKELEHLRLALRDLDRRVKPGGRVVVLSYHSLEDRIVKETFRERARQGIWRVAVPDPLVPGPDETRRNPRSRSAKLRSVVRLGAREP
ncbi:MAG: 16S rRNA (cytosine(1402)-N(4))-methyltransferase RsmH [Planctomycetes bacterium]|nr:16S rRNA (cytosine(1402)-N(4))-methyltransferase RsmH [Planctomycetota bacterium]